MGWLVENLGTGHKSETIGGCLRWPNAAEESGVPLKTNHAELRASLTSETAPSSDPMVTITDFL
jgi:hypothetical protein